MDNGLIGVLAGFAVAGAPALVALMRTVDRAKRAERALEKFEERNRETVDRLHGRIDELRDELHDTWILVGARPAPRSERKRKLTQGTVQQVIEDSSSER